MSLNKGVLIVIEGIDGGGKTTQAQTLIQKLKARGFDTEYFREPSDSQWGQLIREKATQKDSITPEEELDLFQKDRKENVDKNLRPALQEKKIVVLDRYYFSTMAYQGAKGLNPQQIQKMNESFAARPDLVFILDIKADQGLKRIEDRKQKDLLFEQEDYLVKVRKIFQGLEGDNIFHLDAHRDVKAIAADIEQITFDYLTFFIEDES